MKDYYNSFLTLIKSLIFEDAILEGHTSTVSTLAALPNGLLASGGHDKVVRVWDVKTRACLLVLKGHTAAIGALIALPDGRLASGAEAVRLWTVCARGSAEDKECGGVAARCLNAEPVRAPGEELVKSVKEGGGTAAAATAAACASSAAPLHRAPPPAPLHPMPRSVAGSAGTASGGGAANGSGGGGVLLPPFVGHCIATLLHGGHVSALALVDGGHVLVSGSSTSFAPLRLWSPSTLAPIATIEGKGSSIAALPGGKFAAAAYSSMLVDVWAAGKRERLNQLRGHVNKTMCVASLAGNVLASGAQDNTVRLWDAGTGALLSTLTGHTHTVYALAALPDGRLASSSGDHTVRIWVVASRKCMFFLQTESVVHPLAALEGGRLASGCSNGTVYIWVVSGTAGVRAAVLEGHTAPVTSLAALPGGQLASGSADKTVRLWDLAARSCIAVLKGHTAAVGALVALPNGRLASGGEMVRIWAVCARGSKEDKAGEAAAAKCVVVQPLEGEGVAGGGGGAPRPCRSPLQPLVLALPLARHWCCKNPLFLLP